jgi:hypothetical protein
MEIMVEENSLFVKYQLKNVIVSYFIKTHILKGEKNENKGNNNNSGDVIGGILR